MSKDWRRWRTYKPESLCRPLGGSDYCQYCGADLCGDNRNCEHLQRARLFLIPDDEILAFGCSIENAATKDGIPLEMVWHCKKWCHKPNCPFTLKEQMTQ